MEKYLHIGTPDKKHIHDTVSLCNTCYKHIPGEVYEQNGMILLDKECPEHGSMTGTVEIDPDFYYSLEYTSTKWPEIMIDVTDRCNLNCPHCYHLPDNKKTDRSAQSVIDQLSSYPDLFTPILAGAEPTLRDDFIDLCRRIDNQIVDKLYFITLSNGIKFSDPKFTQDASNAGLGGVCFGLNHYTYQGKKVHEKQIQGIKNIQQTDMVMPYIGYTIETLDHIPDILHEIKDIHHHKNNMYRIRCGSFIGRSNDQHRSYLSTTYKYIKNILGDSCSISKADNNPYHINVHWDEVDRDIRIIQWPDVTNIDMEELTSGPYAQFYDDAPVTNFVHQVITRDAFVNNGLPKLDECPSKYHYNPLNYYYWKKDAPT